MSLQGDYDPFVSRLILRAVAGGIIVIAATEIGDGRLLFPSSMNEVIVVTPRDTRRAIDCRRNAGKVLIVTDEEILTTMPSDTYGFVSGSSFAGAHVSGIVALLVRDAPIIDTDAVKVVLRSSTRIANWTVSCRCIQRTRSLLSLPRTPRIKKTEIDPADRR